MTMQTTINGDNYAGTLDELLDSTVFDGYTVNFCTKRGTVVMMSERDLRGLVETLDIQANPRLHERIIEGMRISPSECLSEEEVAF
jgi:hypothetical protein